MRVSRQFIYIYIYIYFFCKQKINTIWTVFAGESEKIWPTYDRLTHRRITMQKKVTGVFHICDKIPRRGKELLHSTMQL